MSTMEIVERLMSFGILVAMLWYMMTRTLPRTVDVMRDALAQNTRAMQAGFAQMHVRQERIAQESDVAHQSFAQILGKLTESVDLIRRSSEESSERIVQAVDRLKT